MIPKRILFITEGGLGDHITLSPALRELKRSFPDSFVCVFTTYRRTMDATKENPFANLYPSQIERDNSFLATNKNIDELYTLNRYAFKSLSIIARVKAELAVIRFLRRKNFDTVISTFPYKDRFILWALASGATNRIGARNQGLRWLLTHTPDIEKSRGGVVEYYCDLVRTIGVTVHSLKTEYVIPEISSTWADLLFKQFHLPPLKRIVAVHPGASGKYKVWPPERYAALINNITTRHNVIVVLLKGEQDNEVIADIKKHLQTEIFEVYCGESIGHLAAILERCSLCISNDSGPRHLAIAIGTMSLAFFRIHHDLEWDVYKKVEQCVTLKGLDSCPVCTTDKCFDRIPEGEQYGSFCLRMISIEAAIHQVDTLLNLEMNND